MCARSERDGVREVRARARERTVSVRACQWAGAFIQVRASTIFCVLDDWSSPIDVTGPRWRLIGQHDALWFLSQKKYLRKSFESVCCARERPYIIVSMDLPTSNSEYGRKKYWEERFSKLVSSSPLFSDSFKRRLSLFLFRLFPAVILLACCTLYYTCCRSAWTAWIASVGVNSVNLASQRVHLSACSGTPHCACHLFVAIALHLLSMHANMSLDLN